jgi:transcription elongation factor Elf1
MAWLDQKYIGIVGTRLERFKKKSNTLYNFRCPVCGDSDSHKNKARGYIYQKEGKMMFHCHNCGTTLGLPNFLKMVDVNLYNEYQLEKLQDYKDLNQKKTEDFQSMVEKMRKPVFMSSGPLKGLKKVSQLSPDNPIKKLVVDRKIPNPYHAKLFACPNFFSFVNNLIPDKFPSETLARDETRLLIPFLDTNKTVHAFQGRSLRSDSKTKYITIVLNDSVPKLFGLDALNPDRTTYVVEGPIDSMFVNNSIATAGGDLISAVKDLKKENLVIVYDNEPRSKETKKKLDKAIYHGYNVVIWPENLEHKDINDMVIAGMSSDFIEHIMKQNTYKDLSAKLALQKWSKV